MGIVAIGAIFVDIKGYSLSTYIPGGRNVGAIDTIHGGVTRNLTEDIANLELKPTLLSIVDDTPLGEDVLKKLERHKVDTRYIQKIKGGMGTWLAVFDHAGDVVASVSSRPDLMPILNVLEQHGDEIFSQADSIAIEIDIEKEIVKKVFQLAQKHNKAVYSLVSNMSIAVQRRDFIKSTSCFVCNQQEAGIYFSEDYSDFTPEQMREVLADRVKTSRIPKMVVTMGEKGSVYATSEGESGMIPAIKTDVIDTTGCGDAFFAGVCVGLTYGKTLKESCVIGTRLASSVINTHENVNPRFLPEEFGIQARD